MTTLQESDDSRSHVMLLLEQRKYEEALPILSDLIEKNPSHREYFMYHLLVVRILVLHWNLSRATSPVNYLCGIRERVVSKLALIWHISERLRSFKTRFASTACVEMLKKHGMPGVDRYLSQGVPRLINTLCDNALLHACRASIYRISGAIINDVNNQLGSVERSQVSTETKIHQLAHEPPWKSSLVDDDAVDEVATQLQLGAPSLSTYVQVVPKRERVEGAAPTDYVEGGDSILFTFIKAVRQKPTFVAVAQFTLNWLRSQRSEFTRTAISIGGLLILIFSLWGFVAVDSKHRGLNRSDVSRDTEKHSSKVTVLAVPDTPLLSYETAPTELLQPIVILHQQPPLLEEHNNETSVSAGNGEVALNRKVAQRPSTEIYHVTAPVFLRNSPTAEAEITTIEPGTRIAVTRVSNEYFGVRSLADPRVSGFVHREDAFFERTQ